MFFLFFFVVVFYFSFFLFFKGIVASRMRLKKMRITISLSLKLERMRKQIENLLFFHILYIFTFFFSYVADLGINDDMDPGVFVIAWKLGCVTPWVITKTEWMNGWSHQGAGSIAEMKTKLSGWRKDLEDNKVLMEGKRKLENLNVFLKVFTLFYNWVFDHMRGDKRILDWEQTKVKGKKENRKESCFCFVSVKIVCRFFGKLFCRAASGQCSANG